MSRTVLSNELADLAERVKAAVVAKAAAERTAAGQAISAGMMLLQARSHATHGAWGAFLERAGVKERYARKLMQLARSGLKPATVADLGGVKSTLIWLQGLRLPRPGEALIIHRPDDADSWPFGILVPTEGRDATYDVARVEPDAVDFVRRPLRGPPAIRVLLHLMDGHLPAMTFEIIPDDDGFWGDVVRGTGLFSDQTGPDNGS